MYFEETVKDALLYSDKVANILIAQKARYDILKSKSVHVDPFQTDFSNNILLPFGTLIHGTTFGKEKLIHIKQEGILSSEFALNIPEMNTETYYMADFFKIVVNSPITINTLLNCYNRNQVIDYLPNDNTDNSPCKVAFVVNTSNAFVKNYIKMDLFSDNNIDLLEFIDEDFYYCLQSRKRMHQYNNILGQASIPLGIPFNALSAIIVDCKIENSQKEKLEFIKDTFGEHLYIISSTGKLITRPHYLTQDSDIVLA